MTGAFSIGYEIESEEELAAFAEAYRQACARGQWPEGDWTVPSQSTGAGERIFHRLNVRLPEVAPDARRPPLPLKAGAHIPVLIERIENNEGHGGHVLFLDGHVDYMAYPGRWPMTPRTVALLDQMDRMGRDGGAE